MVFGYYNRLTRSQQAVYRKSDEMHEIRLPGGRELHWVVTELATALKRQDRGGVEAACRALMKGICEKLGVSPVRITVLAARPHNDYGELHGLYEPREGRKRAHITLWMRTARREQVVAFRTFLRTLLHEGCHHFDFELLDLPESFHTEGFYKRESSLFHQLTGSMKRD